MTLHRFHLTTRKTGRNRRSMLEHLLRMEEETYKIEKSKEVSEQREEVKRILEAYKKTNQIEICFDFNAIQEYMHHIIEQKKEIKFNIGIYTSALIEQIEGDHPITIDLQGKTFHLLLTGINTPRHITIQNTNGDFIGCYAGSYQGIANIHFKNIYGNRTGVFGGILQGHISAIFEEVNGEGTGAIIGQKGSGSVVAYNITGAEPFSNHQGVLVIVNPYETPRIEGIDNTETRLQIQTLIAANASPQEILNYIEANK